MARFRWRKRLRFGPLFVQLANGRVTSWGIKVGRFTHNITRRTSTVDTPGPGYVQHKHGGGGRR